MTGQVIAVAVATAGVVSAVIGVLGYRLQARQASRQASEAAVSRAQTVYLSGMTLLASDRSPERLVGMVELHALAIDPTAQRYADLAQQALDHLVPVLDSLPSGVDGPDPPGPH